MTFSAAETLRSEEARTAVKEIKRYLTVVNDLNVTATQERIDTLSENVPEAQQIHWALKTISGHLDTLFKEMRKDVDAVIGEVTQEVATFAYQMKAMNTKLSSQNTDLKARCENAEKVRTDLEDQIEALTEENRRLKEIEDFRERLLRLETSVLGAAEPVKEPTKEDGAIQKLETALGQIEQAFQTLKTSVGDDGTTQSTLVKAEAEFAASVTTPDQCEKRD
jgi:DNA repair exonuclease SbcCD ATPase subunit